MIFNSEISKTLPQSSKIRISALSTFIIYFNGNIPNFPDQHTKQEKEMNFMSILKGGIKLS